MNRIFLVPIFALFLTLIPVVGIVLTIIIILMWYVNNQTKIHNALKETSVEEDIQSIAEEISEDTAIDTKEYKINEVSKDEIERLR